MSSTAGPADVVHPWPTTIRREPCAARKLIKLDEVVHPFDRDPKMYAYSCIMPASHGGLAHMGCAHGLVAVYWSHSGSVTGSAKVSAGGHAWFQIQEDITICGCPACQGRALTCPWCGSARVLVDAAGLHQCRNVHDDDAFELNGLGKRKPGVLDRPCGRLFRDSHVRSHEVHRAVLELTGIERDLDDL